MVYADICVVKDMVYMEQSIIYKTWQITTAVNIEKNVFQTSDDPVAHALVHRNNKSKM